MFDTEKGPSEPVDATPPSTGADQGTAIDEPSTGAGTPIDTESEDTDTETEGDDD